MINSIKAIGVPHLKDGFGWALGNVCNVDFPAWSKQGQKVGQDMQ